MYTILMKNDKSLVATARATLFQRENLVDKIQFLIPEKYGDLNLMDCEIVFKYVTPVNEADSEILIKSEELYKDRYIVCTFPVEVDFNKAAGDVIAHLSMMKLSTKNGLHEEVMHTGEIVIPITPRSDYFAFVSNKSLDVLDQKILDLNAKMAAMDLMAESYQVEKADDLDYNNKTNVLQLTAEGKPIGKPVVVECDATKIETEGIPVVEFNVKKEEEPIDEVDNVVEF